MKIEELPIREYLMFAMGALHAENYEIYVKQFTQTFLSQPERLNPEDAILHSEYGNIFCCGCKKESCVCDSPTS